MQKIGKFELIKVTQWPDNKTRLQSMLTGIWSHNEYVAVFPKAEFQFYSSLNVNVNLAEGRRFFPIYISVEKKCVVWEPDSENIPMGSALIYRSGPLSWRPPSWFDVRAGQTVLPYREYGNESIRTGHFQSASFMIAGLGVSAFRHYLDEIGDGADHFALIPGEVFSSLWNSVSPSSLGYTGTEPSILVITPSGCKWTILRGSPEGMITIYPSGFSPHVGHSVNQLPAGPARSTMFSTDTTTRPVKFEEI